MILFICHGNVARSQFAEAILRNKGIDDVQSAGTHVSPEREGNMLSHDGEKAVNAVRCFFDITGIDISDKRRKSLSHDLVKRSKRIIVMTERRHLPNYVLEARAEVEYWKIEDPHDMNMEGYRKVIDDIYENIDALAKYQ